MQTRTTCVLAVQTFLENTWVLGDIFLRNYFVKIDYDRKQVTFVSQERSSWKGWVIYGCLVLGLALCVVLHCYCKKRSVLGERAF